MTNCLSSSIHWQLAVPFKGLPAWRLLYLQSMTGVSAGQKLNSRDVLCQCAHRTREKAEPAGEDESPLPRAVWWQWRSVVSLSHQSSPGCRTQPLQGRNSQSQGEPSLLLI